MRRVAVKTSRETLGIAGRVEKKKCRLRRATVFHVAQLLYLSKCVSREWKHQLITRIGAQQT